MLPPVDGTIAKLDMLTAGFPIELAASNVSVADPALVVLRAVT
jgi:hypothetical protein